MIEGSQNQDKRHILRDVFKTLVKENITDQMEELLTYISYIKINLFILINGAMLSAILNRLIK